MTDATPRELFRLHPSPSATVIELLLPEMMDSLELDRLNEALLAAVDAAPSANWVLDLAGTAYMGSAVLGLLVNVRQRVKSANGRLALCSLSPTLVGIFYTSSLHRLFALHPTRPDALASFPRR
jgi:anti-anti-sigma factor